MVFDVQLEYEFRRYFNPAYLNFEIDEWLTGKTLSFAITTIWKKMLKRLSNLNRQ